MYKFASYCTNSSYLCSTFLIKFCHVFSLHNMVSVIFIWVYITFKLKLVLNQYRNIGIRKLLKIKPSEIGNFKFYYLRMQIIQFKNAQYLFCFKQYDILMAASIIKALFEPTYVVAHFSIVILGAIAS